MKKAILMIASWACVLMILNMLFIQKNYAQEPVLMGILAMVSVILTFINTQSSRKTSSRKNTHSGV